MANSILSSAWLLRDAICLSGRRGCRRERRGLLVRCMYDIPRVAGDGERVGIGWGGDVGVCAASRCAKNRHGRETRLTLCLTRGCADLIGPLSAG